jgi:branched-chain amino acid aminotransferase
MTELAYFNGRLVPRDEARISVLDYGFLFGYGLYETVRAYQDGLFRLDAHLERLNESAARLGIALDLPALKQGTQEAVSANRYAQTRVRITVSIGEGTMTPDLASCRAPTVVVLAGEYHPFPPERYERGFKAVISSIRRNSQSPVTYMKSANTMESMLARREAKGAGADEALFLNDRGYLTEASGSNVFLVKEGIIMTPRLQSGILPGVTRTALFEAARSSGLIVKEAGIRPGALFEADEAFLTNSLIEVMPLTEVDGRGVGGGAVGIVTGQLMAAYRELVVKELRGQ